MNLIDEKYVEEAAPYNAKPFVILKKKGLRRAVLLAASLCLLVAILVGTLLGMLQKETPKEPEFVDGPLYTYEEFAELTAEDPNIMGVPTNKYTKVTVKDPNALQATSLHFDEPALIYDYITVRKDLNENELKAFSDPIVERDCNMVGESVPEYGFWGQTRYDGEEVIRNDVENNEIGTRVLSLYQYQDHYSISFFGPSIAFSIEDCLLSLDGVTISSSIIRSAIEIGDVEYAARLLGRYFSITSAVTDGQALARKLGFPTANGNISENRLIPRKGVYATRTLLGEEYKYGITNIGARPTVNGKGICMETHLFDFNGDLYGQALTIEFLSFIRDEEKFDSVDAMSEQIYKDIEKAKMIIK